MTRQQMIEHFERNGVKCIYCMGSGSIVIESGQYRRIFSSVTEAHKSYYGYK